MEILWRQFQFYIIVIHVQMCKKTEIRVFFMLRQGNNLLLITMHLLIWCKKKKFQNLFRGTWETRRTIRHITVFLCMKKKPQTGPAVTWGCWRITWLLLLAVFRRMTCRVMGRRRNMNAHFLLNIFRGHRAPMKKLETAQARRFKSRWI